MSREFLGGGCCFLIPLSRAERFSSTSAMGVKWWQRLRFSSAAGHPNESWWFWEWRKIREWSRKVFARLRWKVLVSRFRQKLGGGDQGFKNRHGKFRYDALSYAMNFDEGHNGHDNDDLPDFQSRYACDPRPPSTMSSSSRQCNGI